MGNYNNSEWQDPPIYNYRTKSSWYDAWRNKEYIQVPNYNRFLYTKRLKDLVSVEEKYWNLRIAAKKSGEKFSSELQNLLEKNFEYVLISRISEEYRDFWRIENSEISGSIGLDDERIKQLLNNVEDYKVFDCKKYYPLAILNRRVDNLYKRLGTFAFALEAALKIKIDELSGYENFVNETGFYTNAAFDEITKKYLGKIYTLTMPSGREYIYKYDFKDKSRIPYLQKVCWGEDVTIKVNL